MAAPLRLYPQDGFPSPADPARLAPVATSTDCAAHAAGRPSIDSARFSYDELELLTIHSIMRISRIPHDEFVQVRFGKGKWKLSS